MRFYNGLIQGVNWLGPQFFLGTSFAGESLTISSHTLYLNIKKNSFKSLQFLPVPGLELEFLNLQAKIFINRLPSSVCYRFSILIVSPIVGYLSYFLLFFQTFYSVYMLSSFKYHNVVTATLVILCVCVNVSKCSLPIQKKPFCRFSKK